MPLLMCMCGMMRIDRIRNCGNAKQVYAILFGNLKDQENKIDLGLSSEERYDTSRVERGLGQN